MRGVPGELELAVLLAVARLGRDAYGVTIRRQLNERFGRDVSFGAVYTTLERLETKGLLASTLGGATPQRGGRTKRYYYLQPNGERAIAAARTRHQRLWNGDIPDGVPA